MLNIENLSVKFGALKIVDEVSFRLDEGQWLMLVGPNGAGKSTIIKAVCRENEYTGHISYLERDIKSYKSRALAREIGVLAQNASSGYAFTVEEIVRLGRYSRSRGVFNHAEAGDHEAVERALALTGLAQMREQAVTTLSGGELQRTFLAQVFAQEPRLIILDEPTNHLDIAYQGQVFSLISEWLKRPGHAVLSVVHDLSLARAYGTHALLLHKGRALASGGIDTALTREALREAYETDVYEWMQKMLSQWRD